MAEWFVPRVWRYVAHVHRFNGKAYILRHIKTTMGAHDTVGVVAAVASVGVVMLGYWLDVRRSARKQERIARNWRDRAQPR